MELVIVRGLPGTGKSTYAKEHYSDHLIYEPDHLFCDIQGKYRYDHKIWDKAVSWTYVMTDYALARGESVVVADVFATESDISPFRQLAEYHGIECIVITRTKQYGSIHNVPQSVFNSMSKKFTLCLDNSTVM